MQSRPTGESYSYRLTILSVRMAVKFPCRMKIQYQGAMISSQSPLAGEDRFIFNQEMVFRDQNKDYIELVFNLITEMGSKYLAGTTKVYHVEMVRSEGQILSLALGRCLDTQARVQIRVEQVMKRGSESRNNSIGREQRFQMQRSSINYFSNNQEEDIGRSPTMKNIHKHANSKTQYEFPLGKTEGSPPQWGTNSKYEHPLNHRPKSKSPFKDQYISQLSSYKTPQQISVRSPQPQNNYYQAYIKIKQKYQKEVENGKIQTSRRKQAEDNFNTLKLQQVKHQMQIQQLQKHSEEKNKKAKEMENNLTYTQNQLNYFREQFQNKQVDIKEMVMTINALSFQLEETNNALKNKNRDENYSIRQMKIEIEDLRKAIEIKERQIGDFNSINQELINCKQNEHFLSQEIMKYKKDIQSLEESLEQKAASFNKKIKEEEKIFSRRLQEENEKLVDAQKKLRKAAEDRQQALTKINQLKHAALKEEYERKQLIQQNQLLRQQCKQYKQKADKYADSLQQSRIINDEKHLLENQLEKVREGREELEKQIYQQFRQQIQYLKQAAKEAQQRQNQRVLRTNQLERQLSQARYQQEKSNRYLKQLKGELKDAKEKEQEAKKAMRNKQKSFFGAETQHAILKEKIKSISHIYELQADKIRADLQKAEQVLQTEKQKRKQAQLKCKVLQTELTGLKEQLKQLKQNFEQKVQLLKSKDEEFEDTEKKYMDKIVTLDKINKMLQGTEQDALFRLKNMQMDLSTREERIQKLKKDNAILQSKCIQLQQAVRTVNFQLQQSSQQKQQYQQKITLLEAQIAQMNSQIIAIYNEKTVLNITVQSLQQEVLKLKGQHHRLLDQLQQKQISSQKITSDAHSVREELCKERIKLEIAKKEHQKFKQHIWEVTNKIATLALGSTPYKQLNQSDVKSQSNFTEFLNKYNNLMKSMKQAYLKQKEHTVKLQTQITNLNDEKNKLQNNSRKKQYDLKNQLAALQAELERLQEQKQAQADDLTAVIDQLTRKDAQNQDYQEQLNLQIQELTFTVNSTKLDYEVLKDETNRRNGYLQKINLELENKNNQCMSIIDVLEEKLKAFQQQLSVINFHLEQQIQKSTKRQKTADQMRQVIDILEKDQEEVRRQRRQYLQRIGELQLYLSDQKESNIKIKGYLQEQENKNRQMQGFVADLMKQKEQYIKKQVQNVEETIKLEATINQQIKQIESLTCHNDKISRTNEQFKDTIKRLTMQLQQSNAERQQLKSKIVKINHSLFEAQSQLKQKQDSFEAMQIKFHQTVKKHQTELLLLQQQKHNKSFEYHSSSKQTKQNISTLEKYLQQNFIQLEKQKRKSSQLSQQMYIQHQKLECLSQELNERQKQVEELKLKISELDQNNNQLSDQLKDKEEQLFELTGKVYTLENRIQIAHQEKQRDIQVIEIEFLQKYEVMCDDYEERLSLLEKEKELYKSQMAEKDKQIEKKNLEISSLEAREATTAKHYEDRQRKAEEDKLSALAAKNSELHQLNDQNKTLLQNVKHKQIQSRRISSELQMTRRSITNLQYKLREYEDRINTMKNQQQSESQLFKRKQLQYRTFRENASTHHWNTQRQVKKILQGFARNYLELAEQPDSSKVVQLARKLENSIAEVVSSKAFDKL